LHIFAQGVKWNFCLTAGKIELSLLRRQLANGKFSQNINAVICF